MLDQDWSSADVPDLISVIVTTYNREDALEAVLAALARQSDRGFEVVIADDGSGPATRGRGGALAAAPGRAARPCLAGRFGLSRRRDPQSRHPRRQGRLLCLPRRRLHRAAATSSRPIAGWRSPGWFVTGNRVLLSPALTAAVLQRRPAARDLERPAMDRASPARTMSTASAALLRLPLGRLRKLAPVDGAARAPAISRSGADDLERVDGFDASFQRLGTRGFRFADPIVACGRAPQGRSLRDRRHSPVASGRRPRAACRQ